MLFKNELKMEQVQVDGATAGGSLLGGSGGGNVPGGGSGSSAAGGNANIGSGNSGQGISDANAGSAAPAQGNATADWKHGLPDDLRADKTLASFTDVAALAKSYIHAQKLVGADKISVPSKHSTSDDWKAVYQKLGLPVDLKDYTVKAPEAIKGEFVDQFKEAAHKSGILPKQAQEVLEWFAQANAAQIAKQAETQNLSQAEQIKGLKEEWGMAFDSKVAQARNLLKQFGDPDLMAHMEKSGIGNDVKLVKFMSKIGESLKESGIVGTEAGLSNAKAPAEALKQIRTIQADSSHPYNSKHHPNHDAAVKEVQGLFQQAYPEPG